MEEINYYVVLKVPKKNLMPIDLNLLSEQYISSTTLEEIDTFTQNYTGNELMDLIRKSNTVTDEYLIGELLVADSFNRTYPLFSKDTFIEYNVIDFVIENISNKLIANKIYNKFASLNKTNNINETFKNALKNNDIKKVIQFIKLLPYIKQRALVFYFYDIHKQNQLVKELHKIS